MPRGTKPVPAQGTPRALIERELERRFKRGDAAAASEKMSLSQFLKLAWPFVDANKFLPNFHLDAICEHYEAVSRGLIDRLVVNIPPGYAKSLITSIAWPAWEWGPFGNPKTRWLCISHMGTSEAPAVRDAQRMRALIQSTWYQSQWGPVFSLVPDQNEKTYFKNDKLGSRVSGGFSVVSGLRGDRVAIDDPTKLEDALRLVALEDAINGYEHAVRSRVIDEGASIVLIMQRLHEMDLAGYLLKRDGWTHLRLPYAFEPHDRCRVFINHELFFEDPRTYEGEPLHPGMKGAVREAERLKKERPDLFVGQYQQRPVPVEGAQIKLAWLQRYVMLPPVFDDALITVDCAFKDSEVNSWVVLQCWGRRHAMAYLIDQWRGHWDMPETCEQLLAFAAKHKYATAKWVEAKANGIGVVQTLKVKLPGVMSTDDDEDILKKFVMGSKEAKLAAVSPYFQAGQVFIPANDVEWVPEYVHELTSFPKTFHDDQVDATSMALYKLMYQVESHVAASEVVGEGADMGVLRGIWDNAFASSPATIAETERNAFGTRATVADLLKNFGG